MKVQPVRMSRARDTPVRLRPGSENNGVYSVAFSKQGGTKLVAFEVPERGYFLELGSATFHPDERRVPIGYESLHSAHRLAEHNPIRWA